MIITKNPNLKLWKKSGVNSPIFKSIYDEIVQMVPDIVEMDPPFCTDIGGMKFVITYSDKSKIERIFFTNRDYFKDWFSIIKKLVPTTEQIPDVLLTSDDYAEDNDDNDKRVDC